MKIVFDTNVLLAGLFTRGVCESLLDVCLGSETHQAFASEPILIEFERNAKSKFKAPAEKVRRAIAVLREQLQIVDPAEVPENACRDADDLPILGTIVAANADVLVTGDKDLLTLQEYQGCPIITPRLCLVMILRSESDSHEE